MVRAFSTYSMTPSHMSGVVDRPEHGEVLLFIDIFLIGIRILTLGIGEGVAELVLLDRKRRGDVLECARDGLSLIGRAVDLERELGGDAPIESAGEQAANAALGGVESLEDLFVAVAVAESARG